MSRRVYCDTKKRRGRKWKVYSVRIKLFWEKKVELMNNTRLNICIHTHTHKWHRQQIKTEAAIMLSKHERHFLGTTTRRNKQKRKVMYCQKNDRCFISFIFNAHRKRLFYCFARVQIVLLIGGKCHYIYIYVIRANKLMYEWLEKRNNKTTKNEETRSQRLRWWNNIHMV